MQTGIDPQQHARGVGRLGEEAVDVVAKCQLQAERHPAGAAAHAARQINKQWMTGVHHAPFAGKLRL